MDFFCLNRVPILKMFSLTLLLLGLASISQCFAQDEVRIVSGTKAELGDIPYQVSLQMAYNKFHFCGGSLIGFSYVLTAAHCVYGVIPASIIVVGGTVNLDNPRCVYSVKKIIIHEGYTPNDAWRNDIALIQLYETVLPSPTTGYIFLPKQNEYFEEGQLAVVSGFGRISQKGPLSRQLLKAKIYIANQYYCKVMYSRLRYNIFDSQVCAYDLRNSTGSCYGDSGGPLVVYDKRFVRRLIGIVSWSMGCARTDYPTVYTRVSSYVEWIERHISSI